jgi:hypothetical protein
VQHDPEQHREGAQGIEVVVARLLGFDHGGGTSGQKECAQNGHFFQSRMNAKGQHFLRMATIREGETHG